MIDREGDFEEGGELVLEGVVLLLGRGERERVGEGVPVGVPAPFDREGVEVRVAGAPEGVKPPALALGTPPLGVAVGRRGVEEPPPPPLPGETLAPVLPLKPTVPVGAAAVKDLAPLRVGAL